MPNTDQTDEATMASRSHGAESLAPACDDTGSGGEGLGGGGGVGGIGLGGNGGNGGLSTNVAYLSPPLDPCFMKKRAHSDSTLHQAAMVSGEGVGNTSPNLSRRGAFEPYISLLKKSRRVLFLIILGE